jgi:AcrR family transcriptional regulator
MNSNKDEEVRNQILASAKKVFQKYGLHKTTMEDIAVEAGKGKSTLYYYFKSKEEIFEVVAKAEMDAIIAKATESLNGVDGMKMKLRKFLTSSIYEIKQTTNLYSLVKGEMKGDKEFLDKLSGVLNVMAEQPVIEILQEGMQSGELSFLEESQLSKAANILIVIMRGMITYLFFENDDNETIELAIRLITDGV